MSKSKPRKSRPLRNDFYALRAVRHNPDHLRQLIASGINPNSIEAATGDNLLFTDLPAASARVLVKCGARVNRRNKQGLTPIHNCVRHEVAEVLLRYGADVNATTADGYTPLMSSTISDDGELVAVLLDHGANDAAVMANNLALIKDGGLYLLDEGADALDIAQKVGATVAAAAIEAFRAARKRRSLSAVAASSRPVDVPVAVECSQERRRL